MIEKDVATVRPLPWREVLTTSTIVLFLIVAITGVMLLLGIAKGAVKDAHEWLGLAFAVVGLGHGVWHWSSIKNYMRRPIMAVVFVIFMLATLAFVIPSILHPRQHGGPRTRGPDAEQRHAD